MSIGGATGLPEKIGKYRVVDRIGRGGMGMIFKAHDPILDRQVALKVISPEVEVTDELRTRFFREAQACAKLNHPNIVTVYDMGEDNGRLFIVMELLEGEELRRLIAQRTALALEEKLSVMLQVCGGLHYAHQKGIVHRDMKPGNIFRLKNGQVKILDFGIAHIASADPGLTRTGLIMGTLRYISPEQLRGRTDHRSDMFSIASVFYELLTARPPFLGEDPMQLLEQLRTEEPPSPAELDPAIPSELAVIVQRAMRKNPDERFHDLEEMRSELELVHGGLIEERQRVLVRVRRQREQIVQLRAALAERVGASGDEEPSRPITERSGLVMAQATERELAGLIEALEATIAKADALAPALQRANELLSTERFEDAVEQFETILRDMPEHQPAREGLARARAAAEANRQRDRITDLLQKARAALDNRRYALGLEILKQATSIPLPADATEAITALREAAEAGLLEQQALRLVRQQADEAHAQMAQARIDAQGEEAAGHAPSVWNEAETTAAAAEADLRREAYAEAKQGFDRATTIYRRSLDVARQAQIEERRTAERARDMAKQGQNQARSVGATQYASDLWEAAEARFAEAQAVYGQKPSARAGTAFTEASALYRRAEEAARATREREQRRADAARDRAAEGRRSAATVDAEHRAPSIWQEAVGKSAEGEAALLRQQFAKATEAFEAALVLYHQAQAQVRDLTRRQREEARKKHQLIGESRRSAMTVEAASHAGPEWNEAETSAAAGDTALAREAWEEAGRAFDQAAMLYRRAEEHAKDALRVRAEAEKAVEATGSARRKAAEGEAARYAPEALKEAEGAEARAVAALSRQQFAAARPLFDEASRLYTAAVRAAGLAAEAEARRLEAVIDDARKRLESGDAESCLERLNELLRLRPGYAAAEALRAQAQETLRQAGEAARRAEAARQADAARQAEALAKRAKEAADAARTASRPVEPAPPVQAPTPPRVTAPAESDDATTVMIRPSDLIKQPPAIAEREDATVLASATTPGDATRLSAAESGTADANAVAPRRATLDVEEETPPRSWRLKPLAAVVIGGGVLAAGILITVSWRSEPTRSSPPVTTPLTPAPQPIPTSRPAVAPAPQPSKPVDREPAELAGRSNEQKLELPPKAKEDRPTPPERKQAELRVLEGRAVDARRKAEAARQAAQATDAPKLAASLWAKADTAQRTAEDAVKQQAFDRAQTLFGDAQKAYRDAEQTARAAAAAAADARKREEAEQARAAARAQQDATQRAAAAEQARVAAIQRQQTEAEQSRNLMVTARRNAEQAGADHHAAKLLASAQTKERDGQTAFARSEYDAAGRLFREAQSDYQSATQEAKREAEMERRQLAMLKSSAEQSRSKTVTRREDAVKAEADRLAKPLFDAAQAKQTEADGLAGRQDFPAANQAYQDAADRYMEAAMRAQTVRDLRAQADGARAQMLAQKERARQDSANFSAALSEERRGAALYDQLNFKDAAEKFRTAERLFTLATIPVSPPPPSPPSRPERLRPPPSF